MPSPIYHIGPSGLAALIAGKRLDLPVFVLANILVDFDVIGSFIFKVPAAWETRYTHALLVGVLLGALWGAAAFPLRGLFRRLMRGLRLPYEPKRARMILSGGAGAAFHIFIDGLYRQGPRIFWPFSEDNPLDLFGRRGIELFGLICLGLVVILWALLRMRKGVPGRGGSPPPTN